jgi:bacteriorhodopsin
MNLADSVTLDASNVLFVVIAVLVILCLLVWLFRHIR